VKASSIRMRFFGDIIVLGGGVGCWLISDEEMGEDQD
jgi:hypothetical protein